MRVEEQVKAIAEVLARDLGLELVEVEWVRQNSRATLRVTIDCPGGISHEHCEALSRKLDKALDEVTFIREPYYLEVSSPGAERTLKTVEDFRRFAGKRVLLKSKLPVAGNRQWRGQLIGIIDDAVALRTEAGGEISIPLAQIGSARLSMD
ncbi:MAG: ribosome maturation factor RimP [Cyanobacteria bacterium NC_groundwater_1444_Ag_S-0.65um_54_12]|nr:ribosome maturation factor RimP [Cyanobacteria bacterium NC_groundwater_1444_Ag_S-0.65um_54_12]